MPDVTTSDLIAAARALPTAAGPAASTRRLRAAWERAPALARSQAALLLTDAPLPAGLTADRLPRALALATLASAEDWAGLPPAEAEAQAAGVLRRLEAAGFPVADLDPLDAVAAAWLPGPAGAATHTDMIAHAAALTEAQRLPPDASAPTQEPSTPARLDSDGPLKRAGRLLQESGWAGPRRPPTPEALSLARSLLAAARRAWLAERHGLALPEEFRRAFAGMSLSEAVAASGIAKATLSRVLNGLRRATDDSALWILRRLEDREWSGGNMP